LRTEACKDACRFQRKRRCTRPRSHGAALSTAARRWAYETSAPHDWSAKALLERRGGFVDAFLSERDEFVYRNQDILLEALRGSNAQVRAALA